MSNAVCREVKIRSEGVYLFWQNPVFCDFTREVLIECRKDQGRIKKIAWGVTVQEGAIGTVDCLLSKLDWEGGRAI